MVINATVLAITSD